MKSLLARRTILAQAAASSFCAGILRPAHGAAKSARPRFIMVLLRGALDGLAAVPPHGDRSYRTARGGLALDGVSGSGGIADLDGFFGLHPAIASLKDVYVRGEMIILPAVATAHCFSVHAVGRGLLDNAGSNGTWFDRAGALLAGPHAISGLVEYVRHPSERRFDGGLDLIADLCHDPANRSLRSLVIGNAQSLDADLRAQASMFRQSAEEAGRAVASREGARFAVVESYGWDTHADQGTHDGRLAGTLAGLADGLVALAAACGDAWRDTVVLVATEFGRTVGMNRMGGTDHGAASVAFLLGGAVAGRRVVGRWPGLATEQLYHGRDLAPTTDVHAISKAVLIEHLGLPHAAVDHIVFPDYSAVEPLSGLFRA